LQPHALDFTRTTSAQPYRTTKAAQRIARQFDAGQPHPPTTQIRVYEANGRTSTLRPLADILSPRTRATLAAIEKGGRQ